jgi:hypothetical protein
MLRHATSLPGGLRPVALYLLYFLVLSLALLAQPAASSAQAAPAILWSAGHEKGDMSEWSNGGGIFNSGTGVASASTDFARSGAYSTKMTITNASGASQAVRLFRWAESRANPDAYYSTWYYFPQSFSGMRWWNIFQFKSKLSESVNDPTFVLNVTNRDGAMYLYLYDHLNGNVNRGTSSVAIPVGRWFHLEVFYKQAANNTGRVTVWQDGVQILDASGIPTRRSGDEVHWSLANYTDNISPSTATIYADDAAISTSRLGPGSQAQEVTYPIGTPPGGSTGPGPVIAPADQSIKPEFKLGFAALAGLLGEGAGQPLENEWHNPRNGDGMQRTSTGLMVWRKADNWTAFTNGWWTWVNGPFGLQGRPNNLRLPWEAF